jgi:hypothetical protein
MSRLTPRQHAAEDFFSLVQEARPTALDLLTSLGLSDHDGTLFATIEHFTQQSLEDERALHLREDECKRVIEVVYHAYALGIAFGLLIDPVAFQERAQ